MIMRLKNNICKMIPTIIFLVFIGIVMIKSLPGEVMGNITDTKLNFSSLFSFADGFEEVLQSNIYKKNDFIDLNGLSARLLGQNSLNERQKLANGALTAFVSPASVEDIEKSAGNVGVLNQFLEEKGIAFLYVLAPNKRSIYDVEFAPGYGESCEQDIDNMINALDEVGVDYIDLNSWYEQNGWSSQDALFNTDHHWKPEAALQAARLTMEYLEQQGTSNYNEDWFLEESWSVDVWEDQLLGSEGKRVGIPYAGLDDISIYKPKFSTNYHYARLLYETTWTYSDNILNESYKDNIDYYTDNPYTAYMHGDSPLRITQNRLGWNQQRILIMGDSFKMPYEYFLTTQFQEVYTLDLRNYTDGSFVQAVEEINPDIVLMCTNAPANAELHEFGLENYYAALEETQRNGLEMIELQDVSLEAQAENNNHFAVICSELDSGKTYTLTVENTAIQGGADCFVQMSLHNLSTNSPVYNHYFAASSDELQKWIFTVPEGTTDNFAVYLYAGTKGHTAEVSVEVQAIKLYQGIIE